MPKGVKVDGEKVRELRQAKGLSHESLSRRTGLSVRTITRIENGGSVSTVTLAILAEALNVGTEMLLLQEADIEPPEDGMVEISLKVKAPATEFGISHLRNLLLEMAAKLESRGKEGGTEPMGIRPGSTIIDLRVTREQAAAIVAMFNEGGLADLDIIDVSYKPNLSYSSGVLIADIYETSDFAAFQAIIDADRIYWESISGILIDFSLWQGPFSATNLPYLIRWHTLAVSKAKRVLMVGVNDTINSTLAIIKLPTDRRTPTAILQSANPFS